MSEPNEEPNRLTPCEMVRLNQGYTLIDMPEEDRNRAIEAAVWRTCSPHEWTWTPEQQADMALFVLWAHQRLSMLRELANERPLKYENHE